MNAAVRPAIAIWPACMNASRPTCCAAAKATWKPNCPTARDRQHFVKLTPKQQTAYDDHADVVARLAHLAKRRPLTKQEQDRLMIHLAMMRMVCDTTYILDPKVRDCPKLAELEKMLEECRDNEGVKVIVFSEWERDARTGARAVPAVEIRLRLAHRLRAAAAPPRGDQRLQGRRRTAACFSAPIPARRA